MSVENKKQSSSIVKIIKTLLSLAMIAVVCVALYPIYLILHNAGMSKEEKEKKRQSIMEKSSIEFRKQSIEDFKKRAAAFDALPKPDKVTFSSGQCWDLTKIPSLWRLHELEEVETIDGIKNDDIEFQINPKYIGVNETNISEYDLTRYTYWLKIVDNLSSYKYSLGEGYTHRYEYIIKNTNKVNNVFFYKYMPKYNFNAYKAYKHVWTSRTESDEESNYDSFLLTNDQNKTGCIVYNYLTEKSEKDLLTATAPRMVRCHRQMGSYSYVFSFGDVDYPETDRIEKLIASSLNKMMCH